MKVSLYVNMYSPKPSVVEDITWEQFTRDLSTITEPNKYPTREKLPMFGGAEFPPDRPRSKLSALRSHFLGLDFDNLSQSALTSVVERLSKWSCIVYTTWNHYTNPNRIRAIFEVSKPIEVADWEGTWGRMFALFPESDPKCKDICRVFFPPYAPAPHTPFVQVFDGRVLEVEELLKSTVAIGTSQASQDGLDRLVKKLRRKADEYSQSLADALGKVSIGASFAPPSERDDTLFKLAQVVAEEWPSENPKTLADLFSRSLGVMARTAPGAPTLDIAAEKIRRAQERIAADLTIAEREHRDNRQGRLLESGRDAPYSEDEISRIYVEQKCDRNTLKRRWIVQRDKANYLLSLGGYKGPYTRDEVHNACLRDLAPATSAGVNLYKETKGRLVRKSLAQLQEEYGTVADNVIIDLLGVKATYDGHIIREATCPLKPLRPTEHEHVNRWLRALAGPQQAHKLLSWISAVTLLDKPCAALLLLGPKGTGKSLLATGLANLWHYQPTPMEIAMEKFNVTISKCPLVFADEVLPKDIRGASRTGELRRIIQDRVRVVQRKFLPDVDCVGSLRFIIAANNRDVLSFHESLSEDDVQAIADRFLNINVRREAADCLVGMNTTRMADVEIAEYALWLRDNYAWEPEGRFLVAGNDAALYRMIASMSGPRSEVMRWLMAWLEEPHRLRVIAKDRAHICVFKGDVHVQASTIVDFWSTYLNSRAPSFKEVTKAVSEMSVAQRNINGSIMKAIQWDCIKVWCHATDYATDADLAKWVAAHERSALAKTN